METAPRTPRAPVACGRGTTLNELYTIIRDKAMERRRLTPPEPVYEDFRPGDIRHSIADVSKIRHSQGYVPTHSVSDGVGEAIGWYLANDTRANASKKSLIRLL